MLKRSGEKRRIPARSEGIAAEGNAVWRGFFEWVPSPSWVFELRVKNKGVTGAEWGSM